MTRASGARRPGLRRLALALTVLMVVATSLVGSPVPSQSTEPTCLPLAAGGHDYHGLPLTNCNFNGRDLTAANFNGATLKGVVFVRANLTGADFTGATIVDSGNPLMPTDFTYATLTNTKFIGTQFRGPTYLTYATLTCADFSRTDISKGTAIFGDEPLNFVVQQDCRPKFQYAVMNCEFMRHWNEFDLSYAVVGACADALQTAAGGPGHDFSGARMAGVVFDGLDLTGSKWTGAVVTGASFQGTTLDGATGLNGSDLTEAVFAQASLKGVDLSNAWLYGAVFDQANLDGAKLAGAYLSPCLLPKSCGAATLRGAFLRNVDLSGSHLEYAVFENASFYSTKGAGSGSCDTSKGNCASANAAMLTATRFDDAYLFGVDFGGAQMHGAVFDGAVLVAANFAGATVAPEPNQTNGSFAGAFLQGANLSGAVLDGVTFSGAFFDFRASGNTMLINLNTKHTQFAGWKERNQPVCTSVTYDSPSTVPANQAGLTCPDNNMASPLSGCGPTSANVPPSSHWNNGHTIGNNDPAASYKDNATFTAASSTPLCKPDIFWR